MKWHGVAKRIRANTYFKICTLLLAAQFIASPASAASVLNARITHIIPNNAGVFQIYVDTSRNVPTACAASGITWTVNVNTPAGQAMASALITAFSSNLPVDIGGTGTCEFGGSESIGYLSVHR